MPLQQSLPTWLAWNGANFPTASGLTDSRTGQDFPAGGLNLGDYFDATEQEANSASNLSNGLLHNGRYRLVHVDSGATVANVKTGTIGYLRAGSFVQTAAIQAVGTGGTAGTYQIVIPTGSGGGSGAAVQVTIANGGVAGVLVLSGGSNYTSIPAIPLTSIPGLSGATVVAQLNSTPNEVTSYDQATTMGTVGPRPVVFLNSITPGNYGFIQELGLATLLSSGAITAGHFVSSAANGLATDGGTSQTNVAVAQAIDPAAAANMLFKAYMDGPPQQD